MGAGRLDDLAVGAQLHPEHPVGGGVLRPHLEDHLVGVEGVRVPVVHGRLGSRHHGSSTCALLGGVKSKGPDADRLAGEGALTIPCVGFTCSPL